VNPQLDPAASPDLQQKQRLLEQLLAEHNAAQYELPPLWASESFYEKYIKPWVEMFESWLRSLGGGMQMSEQTVQMIALLLQYGLYVALGVLILWILYRSAVLVSKWAERLAGGADRPFAVVSAASGIEQQLEEAIGQAEWALALRLRWKLFLVRAREPGSFTPLEFFCTGRATGAEQPTVSAQYRAMFGKETAASGFFSAYDELLKKLGREGEAHQEQSV
jgi:hypothetical protein